MTSLNRFRIVKLTNAFQEELGLPEYICADPEGLPFREGQAFYEWLIEENACEPPTAHNYLKAILPFLTFLRKTPAALSYTAAAAQIRFHLRAYLSEKLGCTVRRHRHGNFTVASPKTITPTTARLFLVALKRFYTFVILKGWYSDVNPLTWTARGVVREDDFRPKMPPISGMTLPEEKQGRVPNTYFCVVSGEWQPRIIDDPNLPKTLLAAFTYPRDKLIARILFESGARVGEVLNLTMGDWRRCGLRERALATNKGSHGERVKEIWWSSTTAQLLRNYINYDRRLGDPNGWGWEDLLNSAPLFVTRTGAPYRYADFYFHWGQACMKAKLKVTPHQARHWFITMALHKLQALAEDQREAARQALITYIGWRNPETIKVYDHHLGQASFAPLHAALSRLVEAGDGLPLRPFPSPGMAQVDPPGISAETLARLDQFLANELEVG